MRMLATHYTGKAQPAIAKKKRAQIAHLGPPLKGISLETLTSIGDPQTATVLTNFVIENNCIKCRSGYKKLSTHASGKPIYHLIPWYGPNPQMLSAVNHTLSKVTDASIAKSGFTSDDWHWTSFANLGQQKYTVMVNGSDGVWSWDGGYTADGVVVAVTTVTKGSTTQLTVASTDIAKFSNGMLVKVVGPASGDYTKITGNWIISNVNSPVNTITIPVDTSTATGTATGVTAQPLGSFVKEAVTPPPTETWINVNQFNIVLVHQNRLFFADTVNLAVYYLPIQQKAGQVKYLPLNNMFRRGGSIRAMFTWSVDGGAGMNDQLVIFSTNGECVIYSGVDPDTDFSMVGIFRFDSPMSKHSITNYGGDLYVLISTGLVPMSTMIRAETEQLGQTDRNVVTIFRADSHSYRTSFGWQTYLNPSTGRLVCNMPQGSPNRYRQMIRHMPNAIWSMYADVPARCWNWIEPYTYFGDDLGNVYQMSKDFLNDNGAAIRCDVQTAWSDYKTPANKHFLAVQAYMTATGVPHSVIDMKVRYEVAKGVNEPDINEQASGPAWDTATWDVDYWAPGESAHVIWNGVAPIDHVGAVRHSTLVQDSTFQINGWDVVYEAGTYGP
jgi:hypothetical protein